MTPIFQGTIRSGKLFLDSKPKFDEYLQGFPNEKRVEVTVDKLKHTRSNSQNRYYWGVVVKLIADHTGHDPEQIHELLKQLHSPKWHFFSVTKDDKVTGTPTSTTRLDTIAFVEYTEKCRIWANEFLGVQIPLPGEVTV